jgi:hypothetical protein
VGSAGLYSQTQSTSDSSVQNFGSSTC